ncbi:MAG: phosphatase PAP2 family protein [Sphingobium sp.]|nr:phosphatase PAP2 family protein [Sphingobium sp.]
MHARSRLPEARPLWSLLGISALLLLTLKLASEVVEGDTLAFDKAILIRVRAATEGHDGLRDTVRQFMLDVTTLGNNGLLTLIALLAVGFLVVAGKKRLGGLLALGITAGAAASSLLKLAYARPRPDVVAHLVDVNTASFPSGHAMNSAVVYLTMAVLLARGQKQRAPRLYIIGVGVMLTLMIGLSRIYLGVHWPTDVLVGWIFGASWAALLAYAGAQLQARGAVEKAG